MLDGAFNQIAERIEKDGIPYCYWDRWVSRKKDCTNNGTKRGGSIRRKVSRKSHIVNFIHRGTIDVCIIHISPGRRIRVFLASCSCGRGIRIKNIIKIDTSVSKSYHIMLLFFIKIENNVITAAVNFDVVNVY